MVGAALLTAETYLEDYKKEMESDKKHKETLYGKVSIMIFLMLGTVAFVGLQMIWYRKFYRKLIRSNRDIDVEIEPDLRRRSYLSVIGKLLWFIWMSSVTVETEPEVGFSWSWN